MEHELRHKSVQVCSCGALLYEDHTGIYCSATNDRLPWFDTRHSKKCVRTADGWECVKQCLVHRAELKLRPA